jgi:sugar phosphate isomerase/epimerase
MANTGDRLACSSNLFAILPRPQALRHIARLGFRFVDLWASPPIAMHADPLREDPRDVCHDLEREGLTVSSFTNFLTTHEEKLAGLDFAAALGARSVIFEPGPSAEWPSVMANLDVTGRLIGTPGDSLERFLETAAAYFRRAEQLGLTIALEVPHVATVVANLAHIKRLVALEPSPTLKLTFAPPHLALAGGNLREAVRAVAERVTIFYFWNVKPGYLGSRDGRAYGSGEQQLAPDGALDVHGAAEELLAASGSRDYVIGAHGTEKNPDGDDVARMVRASLRQVPAQLLEQLRVTPL